MWHYLNHYVNATFVRKQEKKVIYAPCDVKPFSKSGIFRNADIMVIGNTIVGEVLKGGYILKDGNSPKDELFGMDEIKLQ